MLRYGQDYVDIGEPACEAPAQRRRLASLNAAAQSLGYALIEREAASVRYQVIKINVLQPGFRSAIMIRVSWRGPRRTGKNQN